MNKDKIRELSLLNKCKRIEAIRNKLLRQKYEDEKQLIDDIVSATSEIVGMYCTICDARNNITDEVSYRQYLNQKKRNEKSGENAIKRRQSLCLAEKMNYSEENYTCAIM